MKFFPLVTFFTCAVCALSLGADDVSARINRANQEQQLIAQMIEDINEDTIQRRGQSNPEIEYALQVALAATGIGLLKAWKRPADRIEAAKAAASLLILLIGARAAWNLFIDWCHSAGEYQQISELVKQNATRAEIIAYLQDARECTLAECQEADQSSDTFSDEQTT